MAGVENLVKRFLVDKAFIMGDMERKKWEIPFRSSCSRPVWSLKSR